MKILPVINSKDATSIRGLHTLAIDLGFAEKSASCGLSGHPRGLKFANAVSATAAWLSKCGDQAVIILEAPLSGAFDGEGNPCARGAFETHHSKTKEASSRRWQSGPGASMALAALHFLRLLGERVRNDDVTVYLVEAFCSRHGENKPSHTQVAEEILRAWNDRQALVEVTAGTPLSILKILDPHAPEKPPAILRIPDGFPRPVSLTIQV